MSFFCPYNESQWGPKLGMDKNIFILQVWNDVNDIQHSSESSVFQQIPNQVYPNDPITDIHLY